MAGAENGPGPRSLWRADRPAQGTRHPIDEKGALPFIDSGVTRLDFSWSILRRSAQALQCLGDLPHCSVGEFQNLAGRRHTQVTRRRSHKLPHDNGIEMEITKKVRSS